MRSEDREAVGARQASDYGKRRLAERFGRLGRWARDRRAAPWRVAVLATVAALAAATSMALLGPEARQVEWLDSGRAFVPDEADAIRKALAIKGIGAEVDDRGRVGVAPEQVAEALKCLDQQGLSRRALFQEVDDPERPSLLADPLERADVIVRGQARRVERALEGIPGVHSAVVILHPRPSRPSFSKPEIARAGIRLWADRGRSISPTTVERVLSTVTTFTELQAEDVMIIDANGDALLKAGDQSFARSMRAEARARGWEAAIAEEVARVVDNARVEVRLEGPIDDRSSSMFGETVATPIEPTAAVVPNGPMSLDQGPSARPAEEAIVAEPVAVRANVLVDVPASYYLTRHAAFFGDRDTRPEDLEPFVDFTQERIRKIVGHIVPEEALGRLQILMGPLLAERPEPQATARVTRRWMSYWWAPATALGVGAALALGAAAGGWLPRRGAAGRSVGATAGVPPPPHRPPMRDDDAPGPADRVRELVRHDPDAAAAVLRRWVGQGGDA